jgi:hypothetical protein
VAPDSSLMKRETRVFMITPDRPGPREPNLGLAGARDLSASGEQRKK